MALAGQGRSTPEETGDSGRDAPLRKMPVITTWPSHPECPLSLPLGAPAGDAGMLLSLPTANDSDSPLCLQTATAAGA